MHYRPWSIIVLAIFHFFEPVIKLAFYALYYRVSPLDLIHTLNQKMTLLELGIFYLAAPLAGVSIFVVKRWSLLIFLLIEATLITESLLNINYYYQNPNILMILLLMLFYMVNISLVIYFLLPSIRLAYVDPKMRWWEQAPRFDIHVPVTILGTKNVVIKNISKTGLFIQTQKPWDLDQIFNIDFTFKDQKKESHIQLKAIFIQQFVYRQEQGFGAKFIEMEKSELKKLTSLIKHLDRSSYPRRPTKRTIKNFILWMKDPLAEHDHSEPHFKKEHS